MTAWTPAQASVWIFELSYDLGRDRDEQIRDTVKTLGGKIVAATIDRPARLRDMLAVFPGESRALQAQAVLRDLGVGGFVSEGTQGDVHRLTVEYGGPEPEPMPEPEPRHESSGWCPAEPYFDGKEARRDRFNRRHR